MKTFKEFKDKKVALYLDMDGVFADFAKGAEDAYEHYHHIRGIHPDQRKSLKVKKMHNDMVDDIIATPNFWVNLPWEPGGKQLFSVVKRYFSDNVAVLTAPIPQDKRCCSQKYRWVQKNFGIIPRQYFFCDHKKWEYVGKLPGETQILIDDREDNIEKWEKAGGVGILHNSKNYQKSIQTLKQFI